MPDGDISSALQRLEDRLDERLGCVEEKLDKVRTEDIPSIRIEIAREIAILSTQAKASGRIWGLLAGAIGSLVGVVIYLVVK